MMYYLADKYGRFIPKDLRKRTECMNWMMWQMAGQGPMTGNFGHFMVYAPDEKVETRDYGVSRYGMEVQRLCSALDQHLAGKEFICGDEYTIADMICLPWFDIIRTVGYTHSSGVGAKDFLTTSQYANLNRWADALMARPQVQRGMIVCRKYGKPWLESDRFKYLAKL
jgi:GST-like protein